MGSTIDKESITRCLKRIVHSHPKRSTGIPVMEVVKALYKEDAAHKGYIKETLNSSVIELMQKDRESFLVHYGDKVFAASAGKVSGGRIHEMKAFTMDEVSTHCKNDDAWIVVDGAVYDITPFVATHWGWSSAGKNSTIIAIMSSLGGDCTKDFRDVHVELSDYEKIKAQLSTFKIGNLAEGEVDVHHPGGEVTYKTWDQLVEMGRVSPNAIDNTVKKNQGFVANR